MIIDNIVNCERWRGRYTGPGSLQFALPSGDLVYIFTDHSYISFLKDGTPCESVILDDPVKDAGASSKGVVCVSTSKYYFQFWIMTRFLLLERRASLLCRLNKIDFLHMFLLFLSAQGAQDLRNSQTHSLTQSDKQTNIV